MDTILSYAPQWNSWMAVFLYWMPLALCSYGYVVEFVQAYRSELRDRAKAEADDKDYYYPSLTLGWIVGHVLLTVMPMVNLFMAVFYTAPRVFGDFFSWIGKALDMPLVPKRSKKP